MTICFVILLLNFHCLFSGHIAQLKVTVIFTCEYVLGEVIRAVYQYFSFCIGQNIYHYYVPKI